VAPNRVTLESNFSRIRVVRLSHDSSRHLSGRERRKFLPSRRKASCDSKRIYLAPCDSTSSRRMPQRLGDGHALRPGRSAPFHALRPRRSAPEPSTWDGDAARPSKFVWIVEPHPPTILNTDKLARPICLGVWIIPNTPSNKQSSKGMPYKLTPG